MAEMQACTWTYDDMDDKWDSACGEAWQFVDGGPEENRVRYCHYCGKPVQVVVPPRSQKRGGLDG